MEPARVVAVISAEMLPPSVLHPIDAAAGREHSSDGQVVTALAKAITEWEKVRDHILWHGRNEPVPHRYDGTLFHCLLCEFSSPDPCYCRRNDPGRRPTANP